MSWCCVSRQRRTERHVLYKAHSCRYVVVAGEQREQGQADEVFGFLERGSGPEEQTPCAHIGRCLQWHQRRGGVLANERHFIRKARQELPHQCVFHPFARHEVKLTLADVETYSRFVSGPKLCTMVLSSSAQRARTVWRW